MAEDIKRIDIKEFREFGFLQELNRQFLHPLGMALEVIIDKETGEMKLGGIWDFRDDPEGIAFADEVTSLPEYEERQDRVANFKKDKLKTRLRTMGFDIQP